MKYSPFLLAGLHDCDEFGVLCVFCASFGDRDSFNANTEIYRIVVVHVLGIEYVLLMCFRSWQVLHCLMIGYNPCLWWKACWKFIIPALILVSCSMIYKQSCTVMSYSGSSTRYRGQSCKAIKLQKIVLTLSCGPKELFVCTPSMNKGHKILMLGCVVMYCKK